MINKNKRILPQEGYLCKKRIELNGKFKDKKIITMIKGRENVTYIPADKYIKYDERIEATRKSKLKKLKENSTIGDELSICEDWPRPKVRKTLRIVSHNVAGFCTHDNIYEGHLYNQDLLKIQCDIACLTELNVNLNNIKIRNDIFNIFKFTDRHSKTQITKQPESLKSSKYYYPGGNLISSNGIISGRIKKSDSDEAGRWSWIEINCKNHKNIVIISAYCSNGNLTGINTISYQEYRYYLRMGRTKPEKVRYHFFNDLKIFVQHIHDMGNLAIIVMDANTDRNSPKLKKFCMDVGMSDIHMENELIDSHPNTFIRGSKCIDIALCSYELLPLISSSGYLPFESIGTSDHRPIYIDLKWEKIFSGMKEDNLKQVQKKLTTKKNKVLFKYIDELKLLLDRSKIFEKTEHLKKEFSNYSEHKTHLVKRLNRYDKTRTELMLCALKKCRPNYGLKKWSPELKKVGTQLRRLRKIFQSTDVNSNQYEIISKEYNIIKEKWKSIQYSHNDLRKQHLEELAETAALRQNHDVSTALKNIIKSEQVKEIHAKHKRIFKKQNCGLKTILVKNENDDWEEIEEEDKIFDELIQISREKLSKSAKRSPFMQQPLLDKIGLFSETEFAKKMIMGEDVSIPKIQGLSSEDMSLFEELVVSFRRPKNNDVTIQDLTWEYGAKQYIDTFSKVNEDTSTGPSGLSMPHWKAACFDIQLASLHATFIELPFKHGITLDRWKQVVHVMIPKKVKPYIDKLRNIQLTEADYNGALKFIIGRKLRNYCNVNGSSSTDTFGGRTKKNCIQMLKTIQITNESNRIQKRPQAHLDIDAVG